MTGDDPGELLARELAAANARIAEQTRLYDAAVSLGAAASIDEIVEIVACYLDPLGTGSSCIVSFERDEGGLPIAAEVASVMAGDRRFPEARGQFSLRDCPFQGALVARELLMFDEIARADGLGEPSRAALLEAGWQSLLSAPLLSRAQLIGRLLVTWPAAFALREAGLELAVALARQASAALERLMLIAESQRQAEEREALQARVIEAQRALIDQLLTPVIPVARGVVLMPLIGRIDAERSQRIMDALLTSVSARRAEAAILDISGVPDVTGEAAEALVRVARAARLLGARVVLTGVRPAAASALAAGGVDTSGLTVQASVQDGIALAAAKSAGTRS